MIKALPKILYRSHRIDWRQPENLLRLGIFLAIISTASAAIFLRNIIALQQAGYLGVALTVLLASGSMVLPVPALATVCGASTFLVPLYVGLVAGGAETVGELTGYFLGYSGRGVVGGGRPPAAENLDATAGMAAAVSPGVPSQPGDLAGVTAGALRSSLERFLAVVLAGGGNPEVR